MSQARSEPLNTAELKQYREQGWVNLGRVMDDATLASIRDEEARIRAIGPVELTTFRSQLGHYSAAIRRFMVDGPPVNFAQQLIGSPNVALWWNQFVTKFPDGNSGKSEFPWHQDNGYVAIEPATNVTIWVALDDVDERNGCVWVVPGSHLRGLLPHRTVGNGGWHLTLDVQEEGVPALLKAGEAVAFTGLTLHRSKLNHTDRARRAFFMEYADAAATFQRANAPRQSVLVESNTWVVRGQAEYKGS